MWRQTGSELRVLADAFAASPGRIRVRQRAEQVDVSTLDMEKFWALLRSLFEVFKNFAIKYPLLRNKFNFPFESTERTNHPWKNSGALFLLQRCGNFSYTPKSLTTCSSADTMVSSVHTQSGNFWKAIEKLLTFKNSQCGNCVNFRTWVSKK